MCCFEEKSATEGTITWPTVLLWCCSPHLSEKDQKLPLFMYPSMCNRRGLTQPGPCSQSPIFLWSLWTEQVGLGPGRRTKAKCSVTLQTYEDNIAYLPRVGHDVLAKRTTTDFTYSSKFLGCNGNWKTSSWKLLKQQTWYENDWVGEVIFMNPQWGCLTIQILLLWLTSATMYTQILIKQTYEIRDTNSLPLQNKCVLGITCVQWSSHQPLWEKRKDTATACVPCIVRNQNRSDAVLTLWSSECSANRHIAWWELAWNSRHLCINCSEIPFRYSHFGYLRTTLGENILTCALKCRIEVFLRFPFASTGCSMPVVVAMALDRTKELANVGTWRLETAAFP